MAQTLKGNQGSALTFLSAAVSAAYIKVYLLENGVCVAKKKTKSVRKCLDPLYNQVLVFSESPQGKVVQVSYEEINVIISRFYGRVNGPNVSPMN